MAIPIQYIPEDRTAIARAQIKAEMARTNASMWQAAQENALKERLAQQGVAQAEREQRAKEALFDKEAGLRQSILSQELGARRAEAAEARRAEMEKFRMARVLQEQEPQTILAREQLATYKALTPEERINKVLGRNPEEEKRQAERFEFEKQKFAEQARQSSEENAFNKGRWFTEREGKGTFSQEDAEKIWLKTKMDIAKNPLLSNVETQLDIFANVATAAPGTAPYERYLNLAKESFLNKNLTLTDEVKKKQGQTLINMLSIKKDQLARAEDKVEQFRTSPEIYSMKKLELEQERANLTRLESETALFLQQMYEKDKSRDWWGMIKEKAPETLSGLSIATGGPLLAYSLGYKGLKSLFGKKEE